ncbi:MAG: complex I subunit 5 family protein [Clostridiales bacterium]|nr:complex I subunit 5 family protein [Clostridiales bacterium]MDO4350346.1 complex I subunit 5 family protein [Eubacteriales bacterium]MDY4008710.1 complex I subunit 5 family protein [Candidatus Limiplasma sp.]
MNGALILLLLALVPMLCAPLAWALGRKNGQRAIWVMIGASAVEAAALALLLGSWALSSRQSHFAGYTLAWDGFLGMGIRMELDGFRGLYALIASGMWLVTSLFSRDYLRHDHAPGRYALFTLITLGATVGLFLSDSLYTAFLFFEMMSLASYPWVAHEETPDAMRAAQTYLYIAVIGGLVMLMGLFLLPGGMATAGYAALNPLAQAAGLSTLWLPSLLILFGFGAKAGAFPLHIWLPKAHPVAPAPASALLSGMLTKAGVLGMLILTCQLMRGYTAFGDLIFRLGVITMFLGALLAIFSTNLKRTLACSSLSQIGFIMVGVGVQGLCAGQNGLAAFGTIQHMVNHSLFKLVLFLCAGVVAMDAHALSLNDVRGYGRKKPLLHFCFLMGMLGISGVPGFSGYISKSLLHEGLLEYVHELSALGENALPYQIGEWVFILSGGMTLCYMFKLYLCLFWQKNPSRQAEYDAQKRYLSPLSAAALGLCACFIPLLGLMPDVFMTGIGKLARSFMSAALPHHMPIPYFSAENLIGAAKSITIGCILYALNWFFVMGRDETGLRGYPERWPKWLDLEDGLYRPVIGLLIKLGYAAAYVADRFMDWAIVFLRGLGGWIARLFNGAGDGSVMAVRRLFLSPLKAKDGIPVGNRFTYGAGRFFDGVSALLNRTVRRSRPITTSFETLFAAGREEAATQFKRITRSISFGLLMFCAGLFITLAYLLWM